MYVTITCMHFKVNVRMKKPTLCCCFIWIIFIELNFTVALLLIRKTWMTFCWLVVGIGDFKKSWGWGDPSNGAEMILK